MSQHITVYPVPGRVVLMPDRGFQRVPEGGTRVIKYDTHYSRSLLHGDLTTEKPKAAEAPVETVADEPVTHTEGE